MTSERALCKTFRLSGRLKVEITIGPGGMVFEWDPEVPDCQLTIIETDAYRAARDEMSQQLANMLGGPVLTYELGTGKRIVHEPKS